MARILCCLCGVSIESNGVNMCSNCLSTQVDITEGIETKASLTQCFGCGRYKNGASSTWLTCDFESSELMALCLKNISGLSKVVLTDAKFIWTEPHSRRIKVKITIQKEVAAEATLQQPCVVEFVVGKLKCSECGKKFHNNTWRAIVQMRQKVEHKRTLFYVEQLILHHDACQRAIGVDRVKGGMDFYFSEKNAAEKFVQFLGAHTPSRIKSSRKLISSDNHNNTANIKYTFTAEIAEPCKLDLVVLSKQASGGSCLRLVSRITNQFHLVDPIYGTSLEVPGSNYWRKPFPVALTGQEAINFVVLDVEPIDFPQVPNYKVVEVEIVRESDFGVNDTKFRVVSHLGNLLRVGDTVKGYDLTRQNFGSDISSRLGDIQIPDVVLIKRVCGDKIPKVKLLQKREMRKQRKNAYENEVAEYETFAQEFAEDFESIPADSEIKTVE